MKNNFKYNIHFHFVRMSHPYYQLIKKKYIQLIEESNNCILHNYHYSVKIKKLYHLINEYDKCNNYNINLEDLCIEAFKPSRIFYQLLLDPNYEE